MITNFGGTNMTEPQSHRSAVRKLGAFSRRAKFTHTSFEPCNIFSDGRGRWFHDGIDVTDRLVWWRCPSGHQYQASISQRTNGDECVACEFV
jgi:hypothetical protein